jgi:hypothetical protein
MEPTTNVLRSPAAHDRSYLAVGTFVVHGDKSITPMRPKVKKPLRKDIFTPLKLETMFNPPSPQETRVPTPGQSSKSSSSKRITVTPERSVPFLFDGRDSSNAFPFTFSVQPSPRPDPVHQKYTDSQVDKSRLRLFHFHYDTFTREHLSALVDAIPVSSSSLSTSSASSHAVINSSSSLSHYRPAKRIKLSPPDDLPRARRRPRLSLPGNSLAGGRKDYIRESKSLVQAIVDTRSFSSPLARRAPHARRPLEREEIMKEFSEDLGLEAQEKSRDAKQEAYSSLGFRRQAADLMAQIRKDTRQNISPMSITDEISALSIDENPPLQSLEQRSTPIALAWGLVGTMSPHVGEELAHRAERISFDPGFASHPLNRTVHLAVGATPTNHMNSTNARSCPSTLPYPPRAPALRSTRRQVSTCCSAALSTVPWVKRPEQPLVVVGVSESAPATQKRPNISTTHPYSHHTNLPTQTSASGARITQIMPTDLPELLERVGNMVFNRKKMVWTKEIDQDPDGNAATGETSDDPFRDFESLVDGDLDNLLGLEQPLEADDGVLPQPDSDADSTLSTTGDAREKHSVEGTSVLTDLDADDGSDRVTQDQLERKPSVPPKDLTVNLVRIVTTDGRRIDSALSSNPAKEPLPTPLRSALKPGTPASSESTPHPSVVNRVAPRRSVSFSDGKTSGRIRGLHDSQTDESKSSQSLQPFPDVSILQEAPVNDPSEVFELSARADRIAAMLECLENESASTCPPLSEPK